MEHLLESVVGGRRQGGGILGETKEAVIGGCWGLLMSGAFFFFFFFSGIALLTGINDVDFKPSSATTPLILLLCASGVLSPFIGIMFGLQGGRYSASRHVGCFILYLALLLGGIAAISMML